MLRFEFERDRKTNFARVGKILLGGVIVAALLYSIVGEVVLRWEWSEFDDERIALPLRPGAADDYHDANASTRADPSVELRRGLKGPTTNLREGLPADF